MKKLYLSSSGTGVRVRDDDKIQIAIDITENDGRYRLEVYRPYEETSRDEFEHLYEALESLVGIVRTLEKEIERECSL